MESKEDYLLEVDKVNYYFEKAYNLHKKLFELTTLVNLDPRTIVDYNIQGEIEELKKQFDKLDFSFKVSFIRDLSIILNLKSSLVLYEMQRESNFGSQDYKHWKDTLLRHREYYAQKMREYRQKLRELNKLRKSYLNPIRIKNNKNEMALQFFKNKPVVVSEELDYSEYKNILDKQIIPYKLEVKQLILEGCETMSSLSQLINTHKLDVEEALYSTLVLVNEGKINVIQNTPQDDITIIPVNKIKVEELLVKA